MLPGIGSDGSSNKTDNSSRRYSLFHRTSHRPGTSGGLFRGGKSEIANPLSSRRQTIDASASLLCPGCKKIEVDLTNTSDHLAATDAELKASRQVISLLQRQIELLRVEKDGLEKLIISQPSEIINQSNKTTDVQTASMTATSTSTSSDTVLPDSICQDNTTDSQQMLLKLIQNELYSKDEEIVKLKFSLKETQNDKEQLQLQLHQLEEDNTNLRSEICNLKENLSLRDQTIVSLSNEVFEQGQVIDNSGRRHHSLFDNSANQHSLAKVQRQVAKLTDTLEAYKKTNELLSNNVASLTERCSETERREIESRSQCQELEAKCCQIQSKLLSLLKEIEQSSKSQSSDGKDGSNDSKDHEVIKSESVKLLIKRLLEDKSLDIPLSWKEGNKTKRDEAKLTGSKYECDELGFYVEANYVERFSPKGTSSSKSSFVRTNYSILPSILSPVEEALEDSDQKRNDLMRHLSVDSNKTDESNWHLKWDNFIKDFDQIDLGKSREFKALLRTGVPQEYRCKVWKSLVNLRIGKKRITYGTDYYQSLLEPNKPAENSKKVLNPSSKQIELDLLRTLPNNRHFETLDSSGTVRLRKVLMAYSEHNPKVGYCQGMNRLAAVALLVLPEEEAFWCLVTIVDSIMPIGYYNDLWLAQVDSAVVMDYVAMKMPQLSEHFKRNSIDLSLFAWFLTIFVDGAPPSIFLRLWDCFLYEGDKILFRIALALLKMHENEILELSNSVAVNNFLRSSISGSINVDHLFNVAFECINPLSTRSLRIKRQSQFNSMRAGYEHAAETSDRCSSLVTAYENNDSRDDDSPLEDSSIISI